MAEPQEHKHVEAIRMPYVVPGVWPQSNVMQGGHGPLLYPDIQDKSYQFSPQHAASRAIGYTGAAPVHGQLVNQEPQHGQDMDRARPDPARASAPGEGLGPGHMP